MPHLTTFFRKKYLIQSILLFLVSKSDKELNWTKSIDRFDLSWSSRYVYSLYFACSTMFTVGYGDVTPKNQLEILTILVVQVVGTRPPSQASSTSATSSTKWVASCRSSTRDRTDSTATSPTPRSWQRTTDCPRSWRAACVPTWSTTRSPATASTSSRRRPS